MLEPILVFRRASIASDTTPAAKNATSNATAGRNGSNQARPNVIPAISFTSPIPKPAKIFSKRASTKTTTAAKSEPNKRPISSPSRTATA